MPAGAAPSSSGTSRLILLYRFFQAFGLLIATSCASSFSLSASLGSVPVAAPALGGLEPEWAR
jgi:hypothetical protein